MTEMPKLPLSIIADKRPIESLHFEQDRPFTISPDDDPENPGMTLKAIIPYHENGDGAPVVWFALVNWKDVITCRINSKYVEAVNYVTEGE